MLDVTTLEFWTAWLAIVTTVLVIVAWWQILALRRQAKGWRTLAACEKYDLDPTLADCCSRLSKAGRKNIQENSNEYACDITTVLNYLDGIATGIEQNLYVESLARDHLEPILTAHVDKLLTGRDANGYGVDQKGYPRLIELDKKWRDNKTSFWDGVFVWRRR